ncbi:hypothetical protein L2E82_06190 [Cichorium intybus]|uniref:Uncharacterized protein n=1 Tax=Cichorium intybus TaxID=13427 RepID=A0ACB9H9A0_CICIN|nr:hypothetical protein L2E82_06190 [Cichorium intybus]
MTKYLIGTKSKLQRVLLIVFETRRDTTGLLQQDRRPDQVKGQEVKDPHFLSISRERNKHSRERQFS